jgi:hypothetical protein
MQNYKVFSLLILLWLVAAAVKAQDLAVVRGIVKDELDKELAFANVVLMIDDKQAAGLTTDENGAYKITVPAEKPFYLLFSYAGYQRTKTNLMRLEKNTVQMLNIVLLDGKDVEVIVEANAKDVQTINQEDLLKIANASGNLESILQFLTAGVSAGTGGELTSQYSVRGGNYDENLIYVNGFEVYRPLLIRASQQEGLTFPNVDMLQSLTFSNGGFKAQYGDKMSSVLDITYRRPKEKLEIRAGGSLLGGQIYAGGAKFLDLGRKLTWQVGTRYKTTQYLLTSQAIRGEYVPTFLDVQANVIWDISKRGQLEFIGNYSYSKFQLTPRDGSNDTGLFNYVLNLTSRFEGKEVDDFKTSMLGLAYSVAGKEQRREKDEQNYSVTQVRHRFGAAYYQSLENERIDILGEYWLTQKETNFGSEDFGEPVATLSYGMTHRFARNFLSIGIANINYRGTLDHNIYKVKTKDSTQVSTSHYHSTRWGADYKNEQINDDLKEWTRYDSLYFTVPFDTSAVLIPEYSRSELTLNTHRFQGFIQHNWNIVSKNYELDICGGLRANYWTLNNELVLSPRLQMLYTPRRFSSPVGDSTRSSKALTFKLSFGAYNQPPFYRELRDLQGQVNTNVLAQRSWQGVAGVVWDFVAWRRRFKFISEMFYKRQHNLVGYDVDNVRVRYYGQNNMSGYVAGWDFRLNGEFVRGLDSWLNLSFMQARERFDTIQHKRRELNGASIDTVLVEYVPKPTDQLFILSMYFQDELPQAPWAQVNVALTVGAGMAFGLPNNNIEYRNTYRYLPYHRIDIGFSFALWSQSQHIKKKYQSDKDAFFKAEKNVLRRTLRAAWLSLEVFNLMQVANQSSYNWIRSFEGVSYGIPNTLTSRRINLRFRVDF